MHLISFLTRNLRIIVMRKTPWTNWMARSCSANASSSSALKASPKKRDGDRAAAAVVVVADMAAVVVGDMVAVDRPLVASKSEKYLDLPLVDMICYDMI